MSSTPLTRDVRHGLAWSAASNILLRLGSFAVGIALARLLRPEEFGVYAVALTVQAVLMTLADFGLSADLIRADDPGPRTGTVGALGLVSGAVLTGIMVLTARPLSALMGSPESAPVVAVLALTLLLGGAGVVPYAYLQREFRQRALFGIAATDLVVSTAVVLGLLAAGFGVMSLAVGRVLAQAVVLTLQFKVAGLRPRYRIDRELLRPVLSFGVPVAGANMLSWALLNMDNVVIVRSIGPVALGFYVLAFNISSWPMNAIGQVVRSVALPGFSSSTSPDRGLVRGTSLTWAMALPAGLMLAILSGPLVELLYGERWSRAAPVLSALGVFGALRVVTDLLASFLLAHGASRALLRVQIVWGVTLVPAVVAGVYLGGIAGAGWAHVLVGISIVVPVYLWEVARTGTSVAPVLRSAVIPTLAAIPAAVAAQLVVHRLNHDPVAALLVGGSVGTLVYAAPLLPWLRRTLSDDRQRPDQLPTEPRPVRPDPTTMAGASIPTRASY